MFLCRLYKLLWLYVKKELKEVILLSEDTVNRDRQGPHRSHAFASTTQTNVTSRYVGILYFIFENPSKL